MGNIRQSNIKTIALKLIQNNRSEFTSDFEENKKKVFEYTTIKSKVIRNRVAGYVTRKIRNEPKY